jgi:misacylated tRNA(Ala) deacylase
VKPLETTDLLFRADAYLRDCDSTVTGYTPEGGILVDRTVFYATSGGQPGDCGQVAWAGGQVAIATAVKAEGGLVALVPGEAVPLPPVGTALHQRLDWDRRHRHMRVHTALHLLSVVIPLPVTGGQIGAERGRLDFDMPDPPGDIVAIEARLNELIGLDLAVTDQWITDEELLANPGLVKTMSVMPPMGQGRVRLVRIGTEASQVDLQPCGGTHVARTAEIGRVEIGKIEKKGRQNRRVSITLVD